MTDKEMLLMAYGALKVTNTHQAEVILQLLEDYLFPDFIKSDVVEESETND